MIPTMNVNDPPDLFALIAYIAQTPWAAQLLMETIHECLLPTDPVWDAIQETMR